MISFRVRHFYCFKFLLNWNLKENSLYISSSFESKKMAGLGLIKNNVKIRFPIINKGERRLLSYQFCIIPGYLEQDWSLSVKNPKDAAVTIENRIYIMRDLLEKSVKWPFCCTVSILQVYFTYLCYITCWALE